MSFTGVAAGRRADRTGQGVLRTFRVAEEEMCEPLVDLGVHPPVADVRVTPLRPDHRDRCSGRAAVEALREAGAEVEALLAIFTYGLAGSAERFAEAGVPFYTLTRFETMLAVAEEEGRLPAPSIESLRAWQRDPQAWADKK